ncbi:hypothetical protein Purlil1_4766 [Purpureocillium lilacinum]|uniref:Uncharacterized protein n=1 Tax=Purpureocillium lilacinum TaxID=33203 RepID=A0ABR0C354_PURLI|nr:hypothetical protein Purlil1_4766 [Purpureocillium lilacinum]
METPVGVETPPPARGTGATGATTGRAPLRWVGLRLFRIDSRYPRQANHGGHEAKFGVRGREGGRDRQDGTGRVRQLGLRRSVGRSLLCRWWWWCYEDRGSKEEEARSKVGAMWPRWYKEGGKERKKKMAFLPPLLRCCGMQALQIRLLRVVRDPPSVRWLRERADWAISQQWKGTRERQDAEGEGALKGGTHGQAPARWGQRAARAESIHACWDPKAVAGGRWLMADAAVAARAQAGGCVAGAQQRWKRAPLRQSPQAAAVPSQSKTMEEDPLLSACFPFQSSCWSGRHTATKRPLTTSSTEGTARGVAVAVASALHGVSVASHPLNNIRFIAPKITLPSYVPHTHTHALSLTFSLSVSLLARSLPLHPNRAVT